MAKPIPTITVPLQASNAVGVINWLIQQINNALSDHPADPVAYGSDPVPAAVETTRPENVPAERETERDARPQRK